jgi:molybdenum cofactor cytidylyltransferase
VPIASEALDLVLLAAGRSARFGGTKLAEPVAGRPLAQHAGAMLASLPFARRVAVVGDDDIGLAGLGFELVRTRGTPALSHSIAAGVAALAGQEGRAIMLALADMPLVPPAHIVALREGFNGDRIATGVGGVVCPPTIFSTRWRERLLRLEGDRGAGQLLKGALQVSLDAELAIDIDTQDDLAELIRRLEGKA